MELRKFDTELKEKLEGRSISPSASSWEKLAEKLDHEQKKSKNTFWWIAIAAVFVGGILIGGFVFNPSSEENTQLVNEKTRLETPAETSKETILTKIPLFPMENSSAAAVQEHEIQQSGSVQKKEFSTKNVKGNPISKEQKPIVSSSKNELFEKEKPSENQSKKLMNTEIANTNEVENLLNEARDKIENRPFLTRPTHQIDAQALLEAVEIETHKSTKDRIFNTVREKLKQLASNNRMFN